MAQKPYIGVTGFMSRTEVEAVLAGYPSDFSHLLMVGVLAKLESLGELNGRKNGFDHSRRYPARQDIAKIFIKDARVVNLIHCATHNKLTLKEQLEELVANAGPALDGLQLNIAWPDPAHLPDLSPTLHRLVLQLGGKTLSMEKGVIKAAPQDIVKMLAPYLGRITDVLIDPSGGKGMLCDPFIVGEFYRAIRAAYPDLGIGFAGGFGPETMGPVSHLSRRYSRCSIDAEGRLRRPSDDSLDIECVRSFVNKSLRLYAEQN